MLRQFRKSSTSHPIGRRGGTIMPMLVACCGFALVAGFVVYKGTRSAETVSSTDTAMAAASAEAPVANAGNPDTVAAAVPADSVAAADSATATVAQRDTASSRPATEEAVALVTQVEAHLAVGEFGPAMELAQSADTPAEQSQLFKVIADAQAAAGEFDAARTAITRIPLAGERSRMQRNQQARQTLAGGGTGADFDSLIDLIMNQTSGPWQEIEGTGGTITEYETGVRVDPHGVLSHLSKEEQSGRLEALGLRARVADLNDDMAQASDLRLVSLTRLDREITRRLRNGEPVVETMKQLAGLTRIEYVFIDADTGEVVIGGPAEGWRYNESGLPVGVQNGKPTLQLDDFVTVARTFDEGGLGIYNCLIVPRADNMRAVNELAAKSNARGPLTPGGTRNFVNQLEQTLGLQDVEVNGVPNDSRVARVIVEADYRMKLIGIDKLHGSAGIPSYFDLFAKNPQPGTASGLNALRWWMTMKYDAILHSPDRDVFHLQGSSVLCLSENEKVTPDGQRIHTGTADPVNRLFAEEFTNRYAELAERDIVFADLQNVFDLSLVAALISEERQAGRLDWNLGSFGKTGDYQPTTHEPAETVKSVANHRVYNGKEIVIQVAGGVRGDVLSVLRNEQIVKQADRLANLASRGEAPELPEGRWWWDAAK